MSRWGLVLLVGMAAAVLLAAPVSLKKGESSVGNDSFATLHMQHHANALPIAQTDDEEDTGVDWEALWTQIQSLLTQLMSYIVIFLSGMVDFVTALLGDTTS